MFRTTLGLPLRDPEVVAGSVYFCHFVVHPGVSNVSLFPVNNIFLAAFRNH